MHDSAAGEVDNTPPLKETAAPHPVRNGAVDGAVPEEEEDKHRVELHALSQRPSNDGRSAQARQESRGTHACMVRMSAVEEVETGGDSKLT